MGQWIDWHSHHTPGEVAENIGRISGKTPKIDDYDGPDFSRRVAEMDAAGIDLQLISQGAGLYADQFPAEAALEIARESNDVLAERIAPHKDRLFGLTALSLKNIAASVAELGRTSKLGFRGALMYPTVDGQMMMDLPEMDPIYAKISTFGWPIFLHGAGMAKDPTLKRLEDRGAGGPYAVLLGA